MFIFKVLVPIVWSIAIFASLLFLPAGTFDWWRAWLFLGVVVIATLATMIGVFGDNQDLLNERFKPPI
ncbi:hypothetical protein [Nostoc sp.]|uniref:hypothetical protein n=1 Tax=Nostoc sp. TaxID=1180 RepID=UPI002FF62248